MATRAARAAVLGAGAWGTALADLLGKNGLEVRLWVYEAALADEMAENRVNSVYFPGHVLNENVTPSADFKTVVEGAEIVLSASPSQVVRTVMTEAGKYLSSDAAVVSVSKGIENGSLKLMHEVLSDVLPSNFGDKIAVLSGPSFAAEVAQELPTAVSLACRNSSLAEKLQAAFSNRFFRVYTIDDTIGAEVGGAVKNVMAIASGICRGLGFGHNSLAAIITRGLAEMTRLGIALGADPMTFLGLSGMGDLVLTCTATLSRNHSVGLRLGKGEKLPDILSSMKAVAEGVKTCDSTIELSQRLKVEMPIVSEVWAVIHEGKNPEKAVEDLMARPSKAEFDSDGFCR